MTKQESDKAFKSKMKTEIIPSVERMIEKEKEHLNYFIKNNSPKYFIENSDFYLHHFKQRLKEYKDYTETL